MSDTGGLVAKLISAGSRSATSCKSKAKVPIYSRILNSNDKFVETPEMSMKLKDFSFLG